MKNKFRGGAILLFLLWFINCPYSLAVGSSTGYPNIIVANDRWMPEFVAGEKATLSIPYENTGTAAARDAIISLNVSDLNNFPLKNDKMTFTNYSSSIGIGSFVSSFKVTVDPGAKPGIYTIPVTISYSTDSGAKSSVSASVNVKIINNLKQPEIKLSNVSLNGERLIAGNTSTIELGLKNESDFAIRDLKAQLSGFTTNGINLDNWPDTQPVRGMEPNDFKMLAYRLYVDPELKTGTYALDLSLNYDDERRQEYTQNIKVYLPVAGKDFQDNLTPRIIIDGYDFGGDYAQAGQEFPLTLSLFNTSENTTVSNIKVSLSSDNQIFSPVRNSNSFYINSLKPQSKVDQVLVFKPIVNAENQTYNITAEIDYQDSKGNKYNEKELISIPVFQPARLIAANVEIPEEAYIGNPLGISVEFYNAGRTPIRNLTIHTNGDFDIQQNSSYFGIVETGNSDYYDVTIIPQKEGELSGQIIFAYENESGKPQQMQKNFVVNVMPMQEPPLPEIPINKNPTGYSLFREWMIIPAAAILILLTIILYRKRKRAQRYQEFEDFNNE
jgi:hypothetical protein